MEGILTQCRYHSATKHVLRSESFYRSARSTFPSPLLVASPLPIVLHFSKGKDQGSVIDILCVFGVTAVSVLGPCTF